MVTRADETAPVLLLFVTRKEENSWKSGNCSPNRQIMDCHRWHLLLWAHCHWWSASWVGGIPAAPPPPSLYPLPPPPLPTPVNGRSQSVAAALISTGQRQECIHRPKLTTESDSFKDLENLSSSQQVLPFVYSTVRIKLINMNKTGA